MKIEYNDNTLFFYNSDDELVDIVEVDDTFDEDELYDLSRMITDNEDDFYKVIDEVTELLGWDD